MLHSYLTIALRYLCKNRIFSLINVLGLAIGLACCILIALFVWDELHYDTYPANAARIYRVEIRLLANNGAEIYPNVDIAVWWASHFSWLPPLPGGSCTPGYRILPTGHRSRAGYSFLPVL
jgi:hypothetical protein